MTILEGRFNDNQAGRGMIKDLIENENVADVIAIVKFKDGSLDVFGEMKIADICYGTKILDTKYIHHTIESGITKG